MPNQGCTAGPAVQIDQLIALLAGLGCSAAVLREVQEAVKAKAKPRVVPAARAEAHRKGLQETAERKQREYDAAAHRASDQAVVADDLLKAHWKARKELDKTAASCASASVGERESVSSDKSLRVKATSSSSKPNQDHHVAAEAPPPPLVSQIPKLPMC